MRQDAKMESVGTDDVVATAGLRPTRCKKQQHFFFARTCPSHSNLMKIVEGLYRSEPVNIEGFSP